jgi:hypothetical protein
MAKPATKTMPREVRLARVEVEKAVDHLGRSVGDIQQALRRAERTIEADARDRIRALRKEAKTQLAALQTRRLEASRILGRLSTAAGGSWRDVRKAGNHTVREARALARSVMARFQRAVRA